MSGWSTATLTQNDVVGPGLHRLKLDVASKVAHSFHVPGQYHRVRVPSGDDATFAIASPPGDTTFEYLIRVFDGVAGEWTSLPVGAEVQVSLPDGPGFPLEEARGKNLLLIGVGTGFAPLRSVIHTVLRERSAWGRVSGAYGVMTPAHLAYGPELEPWAKAGVHITPTVTTGTPEWNGRVGLVQDVVRTLPVDDSVAFLVGQPEMTREVTDLLVGQGLPAGRAFLNFGR
ncbi:MAG TPA: NAD-binding oxidoreductase [Archangium sp.]